MNAVYAFARLTDDLADDSTSAGSAAAEQLAGQLHDWVNSIAQGAPNALADHRADPALIHPLAESFDLLAPALTAAIQNYAIDTQNLHSLILGAEYDMLEPVRIQSRDELWRYCYHVASSVGLICVQIWQGDSDACRESAVQAGYAFQLTNILRDTAEDAAKGRIYLPQQDLVTHGCNTAAWLSQHPDGDWRGLMKDYIALASDAYFDAAAVSEHLPPPGRRMYSLIWSSYRELLMQIDRRLDDVWTRRIRLPAHNKLRLYASHAWTPWYVRLSGPGRERRL